MADFPYQVAALGSLNAVSPSFAPTRNRGFNISINDTFSGTVALQHSFPNDFVTVATATVVQPGTVYIPGQTITLASSVASTAPVVTIVTTQVVSATVNAGGSGGTNGTQTVTGTTGTGTKFTASVTVAGGVITAVLSITLRGTYTVNPTTLSAEPVTGGSVTGATLNVVMGVASVSISTPGNAFFTSLTGVTQSATSGSGVGATFNITTNVLWRTVTTWTAPTESQATEVENGALYRLAMTIYTSGSAAVRLGQQY